MAPAGRGERRHPQPCPWQGPGRLHTGAHTCGLGPTGPLRHPCCTAQGTALHGDPRPRRRQLQTDSGLRSEAEEVSEGSGHPIHRGPRRDGGLLFNMDAVNAARRPGPSSRGPGSPRAADTAPLCQQTAARLGTSTAQQDGHGALFPVDQQDLRSQEGESWGTGGRNETLRPLSATPEPSPSLPWSYWVGPGPSLSAFRLWPMQSHVL